MGVHVDFPVVIFSLSEMVNLYIVIELSRCVTTGVAWMDRRSRAGGGRHAQATSGELRAGIDGSGGGGGVAYEARGYKQDWADERAGRWASRRPKSSPNTRKVEYIILLLS